MPKHIAVYHLSTTGGTNLELRAQTDDILTISAAGRFFVPAGAPYLWGVDVYSSNVVKAYLVTPSIQSKYRRVYITSDRNFGFQLDQIASIIHKFNPPLELVPTEELAIYVDAASASSAYNILAAVVFQTRERERMPETTSMWYKFICSGTGTAFKWSTFDCTPEFSLEAGEYIAVGGIVFAPGISGYFRLIFPGQVYRPPIGHVGSYTADYPVYFRERYNELFDEPLGRFTHQELPKLQVWATTAVSNPVLWLNIVKIR